MISRIKSFIKNYNPGFDNTLILIVGVFGIIAFRFLFLLTIHQYYRIMDIPYPKWLLPVAKFAVQDGLKFYPAYLELVDVSDRSDAFEYVGYTTVEYSLGVVFKKDPNTLYVYSEVPPDVYKKFINSESLGGFYFEEIKYEYDDIRYDDYNEE